MFTVFDLETTGFSGATDDVIQFSYIRFDTLNQAYDSGCLYFYYEGMSWSEEAEAVHHISQDFLRQYEDQFQENCIKMWTILSGSNVSGHNCIGFDCPFVKTWLARQGLINLTFGIINDTMKAFRPVTRSSKVKLTKLSEMCGLTPDVINNAASMWFGTTDVLGAHNATYDTTATAMLTLIAINKGYMTFDPVNAVAELVETNMSLLEDTPVTSVDFKLIDSDGTERIHTFNGHHDGDAIEFPVVLSYVQHNRFESGCYRLDIGGNGDVLTVEVLGTQLVSGKDFDIIDYTTKIVKGGS